MARIRDCHKRAMLNFMRNHPDFARGKVTDTNCNSSVKMADLKQAFADAVNLAGNGALNKDVGQAMRSWKVWKDKVLKRAAQSRAHARGTGGGEPIFDDFSDLDLELLDVLGPDANGIPSIQEGGFHIPKVSSSKKDTFPTTVNNTTKLSRLWRNTKENVGTNIGCASQLAEHSAHSSGIAQTSQLNLQFGQSHSSPMQRPQNKIVKFVAPVKPSKNNSNYGNLVKNDSMVADRNSVVRNYVPPALVPPGTSSNYAERRINHAGTHAMSHLHTLNTSNQSLREPQFNGATDENREDTQGIDLSPPISPNIFLDHTDEDSADSDIANYLRQSSVLNDVNEASGSSNIDILDRSDSNNSVITSRPLKRTSDVATNTEEEVEHKIRREKFEDRQTREDIKFDLKMEIFQFQKEQAEIEGMRHDELMKTLNKLNDNLVTLLERR